MARSLSAAPSGTADERALAGFAAGAEREGAAVVGLGTTSPGALAGASFFGSINDSAGAGGGTGGGGAGSGAAAGADGALSLDGFCVKQPSISPNAASAS